MRVPPWCFNPNRFIVRREGYPFLGPYEMREMSVCQFIGMPPSPPDRIALVVRRRSGCVALPGCSPAAEPRFSAWRQLGPETSVGSSIHYEMGC